MKLLADYVDFGDLQAQKPILQATAQNLTARITTITERPRPFVRCDTYVGPDRRRRKAEDYAGPWRRHDDTGGDVEIS